MTQCITWQQAGITPYRTELEALQANRNAYIKRLTRIFQQHTVPMTFRKVVEATHSAESNRLQRPDGQGVRVKLMVALPAGVVVLAWRVLRVALRSALFITLISPSWNWFKQNHYQIDGQLREHCQQIKGEWLDLGVNFYTWLFGCTSGIFNPMVNKGRNDRLVDYYIDRIDHRRLRQCYHDRQIRQHEDRQRDARDAFRAGHQPPNFTPSDSSAESSSSANHSDDE